MRPTVHSLAPTGRTGGRVYLRMLHEATAGQVNWQTVPDLKRGYRVRRWRKLRHLASIAPRIHALRHAPGLFVWDDLSLLHFTRAMRARTIFILHHYEPLQADSDPIEPLLWRRLFKLLPQCAAVVCVAPYWADVVRSHGVVNPHIIYNAYDLTEIDRARAADRAACRAEFDIPPETIAVYTGKAVHWKGTEDIAALLADIPDIRVIASGRNTIGFTGTHLDPPDDRYLRLLRACDVGVFAPRMREGWSRCAAEALLMGMPSLVRPIAGLGDLARLTGQPAPDFGRLPEQVHDLARTPPVTDPYLALSHFDQGYFADAWGDLLRAHLSYSAPRFHATRL